MNDIYGNYKNVMSVNVNVSEYEAIDNGNTSGGHFFYRYDPFYPQVCILVKIKLYYRITAGYIL